ncbi:hypothetical protein SKAU_G00280380 [Synaphobranchus kaupii]|uniref:Uncharacterized protein n=1 Tax=Synaphobranchus kaupii TaxID=118154 RepID=A0A9Q1EWZ4_SYNKA|nr:hypothetical protein SKAU_G00280380 [Synaphobranchus kaupii]
MLGTLDSKDKTKWSGFVKPLVHAYNCTKNDVTGFTPYELMFGRQPRLPVDLAFGLPVNSFPKSHSQYVKDLRTCLEESYRMATENAMKTAERNKLRFDKRVVNHTLEVGDRVLLNLTYLKCQDLSVDLEHKGIQETPILKRMKLSATILIQKKRYSMISISTH